MSSVNEQQNKTLKGQLKMMYIIRTIYELIIIIIISGQMGTTFYIF